MLTSDASLFRQEMAAIGIDLSMFSQDERITVAAKADAEGFIDARRYSLSFQNAIARRQEELQLRAVTETPVLTVRLPKGSLDAHGVVAFQSEMDRRLTESRRIVLDMSTIDFIDNVGLSALRDIAEALTRVGGELKLARVRNYPFRTMDLLSTCTVAVYPTVAEAEEAFAAETETPSGSKTPA